MTEDETVGWCHQPKEHEYVWTPGVGDGGLVCCLSWTHKELNMTEQIN